ncbi:hypothetical protein EAMBIBNC_00002 [Citrobacter phage BSwM KMM4]|nr:hypothetical protein EAMBIBNC_00002 [Citrobacter phage BSwM KMM4]
MNFEQRMIAKFGAKRWEEMKKSMKKRKMKRW